MEMEESIFSIKTPAFEGPLELLLELIEKRKLLINDISLAAVTDEYMQRVAKMEQNPLRETTQFVHLASTLLLIKSKSLLPVFELTEEEEGSIEELQERLRLYQIYRNAGKVLSSVFGERMLFERQYAANAEPLFMPDQWTTVERLAATMRQVITALPKVEEKPNVKVRKTVSLEDMIDRLRMRVERQLKFGFQEFIQPNRSAGLTGASLERGTVIVGFLAVLEMVKQGLVMVRQTKRYEDIEIEREGSGPPRYM